MRESDWRLETRRLLRAMVEAMVRPVPRQQQRVVYHCINQLLSLTLENILLTNIHYTQLSLSTIVSLIHRSSLIRRHCTELIGIFNIFVQSVVTNRILSRLFTLQYFISKKGTLRTF